MLQSFSFSVKNLSLEDNRQSVIEKFFNIYESRRFMTQKQRPAMIYIMSQFITVYHFIPCF
jgi:hypothetical protein